MAATPPCPRCGTPAQPDDIFCARCGTSLSSSPAAPGPEPCAACGVVSAPGDQFCAGCGGALKDGSAVPATDGAGQTGLDPAVADALQASLNEYSQLLEKFDANEIDEATFMKGAFAAGLVVREGEAWLLDLDQGRWWRYDGLTMQSPLTPQMETA
ncbi:MAG: zinc ribbon domain-containing protein [Dehalococcoidia bacterium]